MHKQVDLRKRRATADVKYPDMNECVGGGPALGHRAGHVYGTVMHNKSMHGHDHIKVMG